MSLFNLIRLTQMATAFVLLIQEHIMPLGFHLIQMEMFVSCLAAALISHLNIAKNVNLDNLAANQFRKRSTLPRSLWRVAGDTEPPPGDGIVAGWRDKFFRNKSTAAKLEAAAMLRFCVFSLLGNGTFIAAYCLLTKQRNIDSVSLSIDLNAVIS